MQVLLHADPHTDGSQPMADHLKVVVLEAMHRFGERITRVEAHLSDVNSLSRSGDTDIHCTLEARLVGLEPVVVKKQAGNAHQAIDGALRKLQRAVGAEIAKHAPHQRRSGPEAAPADPGDDASSANPGPTDPA